MYRIIECMDGHGTGSLCMRFQFFISPASRGAEPQGAGPLTAS